MPTTPGSDAGQRCLDALTYICDYYQVPAALGGRVVADGKPGTIVWADGAYLMIKRDGEQMATKWHPTWHIKYLPVYPSVGPMFVFAPDCDLTDDCLAGLHWHGCPCDTEGCCDEGISAHG